MENKPTILFLSGVNLGAWYWNDALPYFSAKYKILTLDNPGINGAPFNNFYAVRQVALQAVKLLNDNNVKSVYIVGHSMGGFVAQEVALMIPQQVKKLVLISTSYGQPQTTRDIPFLIKGIFLAFKQFGLKIITDRNKALTVLFGEKYCKNYPEKYNNFVDTWNSYMPNIFISSWHFIVAFTFSSASKAHNIEVDTLVIHGENDCMISLKSGEKLATKIPNAKFWSLPNVGHFPPQECEEIFPKIKEFLEG